MTTNSTPVPGSIEALALGCQCPIYEDAEGNWAPWGGHIVSQWCRLHVVDWDVPLDEPTEEMLDHSVVYWYARTARAESTVAGLVHKVELLSAVAEAAEARQACEEQFLTGATMDIDMLATYSILGGELEEALAALELP